MSAVAVIPARYGSTRLEGKPLIKIAGQSLIKRVYMQVSRCANIDKIVVATDDKRIVAEVEAFGGNCVMTSADHQSGTDRIWEIVEKESWENVINVQGDEPLIDVSLIDRVAEILKYSGDDVVTPYFVNRSYKDFISSNCVKIVKDEADYALYFSRSPIPYHRDSEFEKFYHHIGLYGYSYRALKKFVESDLSYCEGKERLEQLRFMENGYKIRLIETGSPGIGVDVPEDIERVEKIINEKHD